jgi:formylglycine-generating enzyme required for sulfatase activity
MKKCNEKTGKFYLSTLLLKASLGIASFATTKLKASVFACKIKTQSDCRAGELFLTRRSPESTQDEWKLIKKLENKKRMLISIILLFVIAVGANAQSKTPKAYKNSSVLYQESVSSVDSIVFTDLPTAVEDFPWEPEMVIVSGGTTNLNGTTITISTFTIGKYEITQKIWEEVMRYSGATSTGGTLSTTTAYLGGYSETPNATYGKGSNYPVYYVSYNDIVNIFLPRLNAITGKNYRLPTEAEWEYAAKGGQQTNNYTYSGSDTIGDVAWYSGNSSSSHVVGAKHPNELGIYDMSGNVWEWCSDWYGSTYPTGTDNPTGASTGSYRVNRGGSWYNTASYCTASIRTYNTPSYRGRTLGFRVVLVPLIQRSKNCLNQDLQD